MQKSQILIIPMVLSCATSSCTPRLPTLVPVTAANRDSATENDGADKCGDCKMSNDEFMVSWTIDYGYRLNPDNDQDTVITPEFGNGDVLQEFDRFFSNDNLSERLGKRTYCECYGKRYERHGAIFYKIHQARLFAR